MWLRNAQEARIRRHKRVTSRCQFGTSVRTCFPPSSVHERVSPIADVRLLCSSDRKDGYIRPWQEPLMSDELPSARIRPYNGANENERKTVMRLIAKHEMEALATANRRGICLACSGLRILTSFLSSLPQPCSLVALACCIFRLRGVHALVAKSATCRARKALALVQSNTRLCAISCRISSRCRLVNGVPAVHLAV